MTEKHVSVRLAAVGGKQVRAELEGVGDAGVKGFRRMSKEAEFANARLAAFSTRVKIAAAVAVAAAAAAGIAMIRSGLETIDAQANLAQSLGTTTRGGVRRMRTRLSFPAMSICQAARRPRHSARAAARFRLKMARVERLRSWLK